MKQIIIRKKTVPALNSKVSLMGYGSCDISIPSLEKADSLLKEALNETVPFKTLLQEYRQLMEGQESTLFGRMYQLSETSGLMIDQNICLYHSDVCPVWVSWGNNRWAYMSGKKYLGDSWWFEDAEILKDIQEMNLVAFLEKYKGF